jgi:hypothetical protein
MRPLDRPCGEQGKQPTAKAFKLAERDTNMSEQEKKPSYMEELDRWIDANVISPLYAGESSPDDWMDAVARVKKAIKQKTLESYRNGQAAGPRQPVQERRRVYQH